VSKSNDVLAALFINGWLLVTYSIARMVGVENQFAMYFAMSSAITLVWCRVAKNESTTPGGAR